MFNPPPILLPEDSKFEFSAFRREFAGSENKIYSGATFKGTLPSGRRFSLSYNEAKRSAIVFPIATITTGGRDLEAMLYDNNEDRSAYRYDFGVSFSDTGSRPKRTHLTGRVSRHVDNEALHAWAATSIVSGGDWIMVAEAGVESKFSPTSQGFFELAIPYLGNNTISTITANRVRVPLYSIGYRSAQGGYSYELAYTNRLGTTTGFGMTPSIDNRGTFSISIGARF